MKLPLSSPSMRSSPRGYASVISAPSASTRAAMVASSNTIDLTGFPPVRRSTSGVLSIDAERLQTGRREEGVRPADARDPHHGCAASDHRPGLPSGSWDPGVLEAAHHQAAAGSGEGAHPVAGRPRTDQQRAGSEPRGKTIARLPLGCRFGTPAKSPAAPLPGPFGALKRHVFRDRAWRGQTEPIERDLRPPPLSHQGRLATRLPE